MDIVPIIPDEPEKRKIPYNIALAKIIRDNDYRILNSYVRFIGGSIKIEIDLQADKELVEKLHDIKDLELKDEAPLYAGLRQQMYADADAFAEYLKGRMSLEDDSTSDPEDD